MKETARMPTQSIIIPHRNRHADLELCLWSIKRSARKHPTAGAATEVIVVDSGSTTGILTAGTYTFVSDSASPRLFNKPRCQNIGIENSTGDILTFLDADMLVGEDWIAAPFFYLFARPDSADLTKLCYRVHHLKLDGAGQPAPAKVSNDGSVVPERVHKLLARSNPRRDANIAAMFAQYGQFTQGFEAYESATNERPVDALIRPGMPFGNSQFSIRRDTLGELRFNEEFAGAGYEDLWMNRAIARQAGESYWARIITWPHAALLHICHERPMREGSGWREPAANRRNEDRYDKT